jgi:hypothetical protein
MITLRDGRDQVKFSPTCGKPTTFRAKCERPLQSVMNFGSAALTDLRKFELPARNLTLPSVARETALSPRVEPLLVNLFRSATFCGDRQVACYVGRFDWRTTGRTVL